MQKQVELGQCVGFLVSRETMEALTAYSEALSRWSKSINLVAPTTLGDIWTRHIIDSAQVFSLKPGIIERWVDLGSGGGLPGIVVSILLKQTSPESHTVLIESDRRKAAFLKIVIDQHKLNATVISQRIENCAPQKSDVVSARALAPLDVLLSYVAMHLNPDGVAILPKGRNFQAELVKARQAWQFELETNRSVVDQDARILRISRLEKREVTG